MEYEFYVNIKDCPIGAKIYSTKLGEIEIVSTVNDFIEVKNSEGKIFYFTKEGKQVEFSKFNPYKQLKAFDKILVWDDEWIIAFFSNVNEFGEAVTSIGIYSKIIPFNDDTKNLVGTTQEPPLYYKYWERCI